MFRFALCLAVAALAASAGTATADDAADEVGVVRLADLAADSQPETAASIVQVRGQSPCDTPSCNAPCGPSCDAPSCATPGCDGCSSCGSSRYTSNRCTLQSHGKCRGNCSNGCCPHCGHPHSKIGNYLCAQSQQMKDRLACEKAQLCSYLKCKFGYFIPAANCGTGVGLCTKYGMVYSLDPSYADPRDEARYAAPWYNMHVNVPLAPNVRHAYNYSWGVPSSRLTPVRHGSVVAPPQPAYAHP